MVTTPAASPSQGGRSAPPDDGHHKALPRGGRQRSTSISMSAAARSTPSSGRTAQARAPLCACFTACTAPTRARSRINGAEGRHHLSGRRHQTRHRDDPPALHARGHTDCGRERRSGGEVATRPTDRPRPGVGRGSVNWPTPTGSTSTPRPSSGSCRSASASVSRSSRRCTATSPCWSSTSRRRSSPHARWTSCSSCLRQMTEGGRGLVFISHKIHEVLDISDRITVLRGRTQRRHDPVE